MNTIKFAIGFAILAVFLPFIVVWLTNTDELIDDFLDPE